MLARASEPLRGVAPISDDERRARMEKARRLMAANRIDAILLEPGSSMFYYTGTRWGLSERTFALILPARAEPAWVAPAFEEARAREVIRFGTDIRTWQEHESPYRTIAGILKDRGIRAGQIGVEEALRFFLFDGVRKEAPALTYTSADVVTAGCRMLKSPAEIALLRRANEITLEALRATAATMREGMTQHELAANCTAAHRTLGVDGGALVIFGKYTASPHGSSQPQQLREGDVVLMDADCRLEGYHSDITRTLVFGKPGERQRAVWRLERQAQDAVLAAAKAGVTCESVDATARQIITGAGFALPHRTGHGIGLDEHEWTNLVRGNQARIQPGMCFSDEPTIVVEGEFGIRLEDCMYITGDGARMFTPQSPSIEQPFG